LLRQDPSRFSAQGHSSCRRALRESGLQPPLEVDRRRLGGAYHRSAGGL